MNNTVKQTRLLYPDLLRIISILFMITIHTVSDGWRNLDCNTFDWSVVNVYSGISRFCVPVFIMISGSFMLDLKREYTLRKLYTHNILRLVTAFVFWSAAYAFLINFAKNKTINSDIFSQMVAAFLKGHYHMWFILTIICLYMIVPFLRKICESKRIEEYFLILCAPALIYNFISIFVVSQTLESIIEKSNMFFVLGYSGYFVLGHYLSTYEIAKKIRIAVYVLGVVSVTVSPIIAKYLLLNGAETDDSKAFGYLLPTTLFAAVAVFLAFRYGVSKIKFGKLSSKLITSVSGLSFGIYLVHDFVIRLLHYLGVEITDFNTVISVPVITLVVFLISLAITFIISKIPILKKYII